MQNQVKSLKCRSRSRHAAAGFYVPSLLTVFLVVIFIALLFGTRMLNRPARDAAVGQVQYSERYLELAGRDSLNEVEQAELEMEACRYQRDTIVFLANKPLTNLDAEVSRYRQECEKILPLKLKMK